MRKPRSERRLCTACRQRKAISTVAGVAAWRHDHPLCPRCFRTALSQAGALRLVAAGDSTGVAPDVTSQQA